MNPTLATTTPSSFYSTNISGKDPKAVAGQFESMFYRMMFEQMRMEEDPLMEGSDGKQVQAMFHDEMANLLGSKGELGIADLVMQDMERRGGLVKG